MHQCVAMRFADRYNREVKTQNGGGRRGTKPMCARRTGNGVENVYATAAEWIDRGLVNDNSLFTPGTAIWTAERLGDLRRRFLDQPDDSNDDFYVKLERQLEGSPGEIYQLMAEVLFVHFLIIWEPSMRRETKQERVERVLGWGAPVKNLPVSLANALAPGFVNLGAGWGQSLPFMVGFIINFAEEWKALDTDEHRRLLDVPWDFKGFVERVETKGEMYLESSTRHQSQMDALFYLVHPDDFEPMTSRNRKTVIANAFGLLADDPTDDVDRRLRQIRSNLEARQGSFDFFDSPIRAQWDEKFQPDLWVDFINRAARYLSSGRLAPDETNFKLDIAHRLSDARLALLDDNDKWLPLLRRSLFGSHNSLIHFMTLTKLHGWIGDHPQAALAALQAIWVPDRSNVDDRIRDFCDLLPRSVLSGRGTRANVASVLLMGLEPEQFPPFRTRAFETVYDLTGYGRPASGDDEAALYGYALGFLDRFIDEASSRGLPIPHRLDAQGILWGMLGDGSEMPEEDDDDEDLHSGVETPVDFAPLADRLYLPADFLEEINGLLQEKKQVIFQGPPGTGKTYVAQELANHIASSGNHVTLVQFHPSYAYDDFVQGYRPTTLENGQPGFRLTDGPLLRAARRAATDQSGARHFLIIDEINRGNISKVFGELYFLLEYRDRQINLQYSSTDTFSMPDNLHIIGTMNTADRSIAMVDLALRRRFYFVEFNPHDGPVKNVLGQYLARRSPSVEWVARVVDRANTLLDDWDAAIGPSYFMSKEGLDDEDVARIWKYSVRPYIEERLFGQGEERMADFDLGRLRSFVARNADGGVNGSDLGGNAQEIGADGVNDA